jgi:Holliday junction resolvase RusA-like endonuclease
VTVTEQIADPDAAVVAFEVLGVPAPQGSKTGFMQHGKVRMVESASATGRAKVRSWRAAVAEVAREHAAILEGPFDGPLHLAIEFRLPMPASRPKWMRAAGMAWHTTKPDLSKLIRATEDALTDAGLIRDDARICALRVAKLQVVGWTGARIRLARSTEGLA